MGCISINKVEWYQSAVMGIDCIRRLNTDLFISGRVIPKKNGFDLNTRARITDIDTVVKTF